MRADVESSLLEGLFLKPEKIDDVTVNGDDFENIRLGLIFDRMRERHRNKQGVTKPLLCEDFPEDVATIWTLDESEGNAYVVEANAAAVKERAIRRKLREAASKITEWSKDATLDELTDKARAEVDAAVSMRETRVTSMLTDIHSTLAEHRSVSAATPSPWRELNEIMRGFIPGRMYIVGARPAVGKSAFASQIAYELAATGPVIFATMEMEKGEVYDRIIAQQAGVYYGGLTNGSPSEFLKQREDQFLKTGLRDIRVLDQGTQTVQGIRAAARSAQRDGNLAGIVVDYIHLLAGGSKENETQRIGEISRSLKQLAMDLKVPVIALSQLNRAVTNRMDGKPTLADLRGSGAIEQDGDVAIFLYKDVDAEGNAMNDSLHVFIAKNRQGPANVGFELQWQGDFVRAMSYAS